MTRKSPDRLSAIEASSIVTPMISGDSVIGSSEMGSFEYSLDSGLQVPGVQVIEFRTRVSHQEAENARSQPVLCATAG